MSHELEVTMSERIAQHVPSAEMVRFAGSGSEANLFAVRLARTFTKRMKIVKFEGCWHGPYDPLHIAMKPPFDNPPSGGISVASQQDTVVAPYNDFAAFQERVGNKRLACVILEPVVGAGGMIPAKKEFLKGLRDYCDDTGALLIFDEVITGFRLGLRGAQGYYRVIPDISVLGKIIGGGLPIGAVCGKRHIMQRMDHTKYSGLDYAYHGGTFAGNVLSLTAGLATIEVLETMPVYNYVDKLGNRVRDCLTRTFQKNDFPAQVTGIGSLFAIHTTKRPVNDAGVPSDHAESKNIFSYLLENGIVVVTTESVHGAISYAHEDADIDYLASTVEKYVKAKSGE